MKKCKFVGPAHSLEDDFEHFLCYSNLKLETEENKELMMLAFKAGRQRDGYYTQGR